MSVRYEKGQSGAGLLVPVLRNWSLFTAINHGWRGRGREKGAKIVLMNDERMDALFSSGPLLHVSNYITTDGDMNPAPGTKSPDQVTE